MLWFACLCLYLALFSKNPSSQCATTLYEAKKGKKPGDKSPSAPGSPSTIVVDGTPEDEMDDDTETAHLHTHKKKRLGKRAIHHMVGLVLYYGLYCHTFWYSLQLLDERRVRRS